MAEIIFTSWVEKKNSGAVRLGRLYILDYQGNVLHELDLPRPRSSNVYWNGALAAPTIGNIDSDADLELVINTTAAGIVAYDLPGTAGAKVLWHSGRNKQYRHSFDKAVIVPFLPLLLRE